MLFKNIRNNRTRKAANHLNKGFDQWLEIRRTSTNISKRVKAEMDLFSRYSGLYNIVVAIEDRERAERFERMHTAIDELGEEIQTKIDSGDMDTSKREKISHELSILADSFRANC